MNFFVGLGLFLATVIPGIVVITKKGIAQNYVRLLLSFSGTFLLAVSFLHLIPAIYEHSQNKFIGLIILLGFLLQLILEFGSKGVEHGHFHITNWNKKFPVAMVLSLCVHAFLEGMPLDGEIHHHHHAPSEEYTYSLFWGIVLHKIPVAISYSVIILNSGIGTKKTFIFLVLFALMTPLGGFLNHFVGEELFQSQAYYYQMVLALVVGMLLHVSTTIIFESSDNHKFNLLKLGVMLLGVFLAIVTS